MPRITNFSKWSLSFLRLPCRKPFHTSPATHLHVKANSKEKDPSSETKKITFLKRKVGSLGLFEGKSSPEPVTNSPTHEMRMLKRFKNHYKGSLFWDRTIVFWHKMPTHWKFENWEKGHFWKWKASLYIGKMITDFNSQVHLVLVAEPEKPPFTEVGLNSPREKMQLDPYALYPLA